MTVWMDMTNSLINYEGGVVDIVRTELMLAKKLHEDYKNIRFSVALKYGIDEVKPDELHWLWDSDDIAESYKTYQQNKEKFWNKRLFRLKHTKLKFKYKSNRHKLDKPLRSSYVETPYNDGDTVFSCGWYGSKKEEFFNKLKEAKPSLKLVYTIYDGVILNEETKHFYTEEFKSFKKYLLWISRNCDAVIYGGETTKNDIENYFEKNSMKKPYAYVNKWGCDIPALNNEKSDDIILSELGLKGNFILTDCDFAPENNFRVLYQAYCSSRFDNLPTLVVNGNLPDKDNDLYCSMTTNPRVKDKIKFVSCSDSELDVLYRNCKFTLLPSIYCGWSFSLCKSLKYSKLCICSDAAPLHEVGQDRVIYVNPHHPAQWAEKIEYYINNPEEVKNFEEKNKANSCNISWSESAESIYGILKDLDSRPNDINVTDEESDVGGLEPIIYYDLSLFDIPWLTGIPRAELIIGRQLYKLNNNIKFFFIRDEIYYDMPVSQLQNTLGDGDIDKGRLSDLQNLKMREKKDFPFKSNDIVISLGMNYWGDKMSEAYKNIGFKYISTIYDFTPVTVPHTHSNETIKLYNDFLNQTYGISDLILYGGATAQKDSNEYQISHGMTPIKSTVLKWGSDIVSREVTAEQKEKVFEKYGIKDGYILTVGTVQPRKNHELLYEAWLELMKTAKENEKIPQLIICGFSGWKSERFRNILKNDSRIKNKVIWITPSDDEIDVLYQNCKFTLLPSIYEGWSLTLPESLCYGKFCIAADTPSLVETGEDIIDYANPYDPVEWANKVRYYYQNSDVLRVREDLIKEKWSNPTWEQCAQRIDEVLNEMLDKKEVIYEK